MAESVEVIRAGVLGGIAHGFLGRRGGVSTGLVAGLNAGLGSGDDAAAVAENRARAAAAVLPDARLVSIYQVHSPSCVAVTEPWGDDARPEADALVTNRRGLLLGIVTADCAPVLLADSAAGVIGAAHAGWKGALAGVIENTVAAMVALGADRRAIAAAIGPCIAPSSYEVDEHFAVRFIEYNIDNERFFSSGRPGHRHFNLEAYVAAMLTAAGVTQVERLGMDTCAAPERFYSYRRATLQAEPTYGRQLSLIGLA